MEYIYYITLIFGYCNTITLNWLITNDVNAESIITTISVGNGPGGTAINPASGKLYVSNF